MAPNYETFIALVREQANLSHAEAERATRATLETLGERISDGEARDIAEQLPAPLRPIVIDGRDPEPSEAGEFVRRVAEREGVERPLAREHARAVFAALGQVVSRDEIDDMRAQLPSSFRDLVAAALRHHDGRDAQPQPPGAAAAGGVSADELYDAVAARTGLDPRGAELATRAVLEALANRISGGELDDVAALLPSELQEPLARGKAKSHGAARPLSLAEFVREIADLEGVDDETARDHARAVFSVLRGLIGEKEYRDVAAQLPDDYAMLVGPPP
jgi:uncharacterized protein (DUF2267 family)